MRIALALLLLLGAQAKPEFEITAEELQARREKLMERLSDGMIVIDTQPLKTGGDGVDYNTPLFHLKYFTNFHDDDGVLVISPAEKKSWFFVKDVKKGAAVSGIKETLGRDKFPAMAKQLFAKAAKVYAKLRADAKKIVEAS